MALDTATSIYAIQQRSSILVAYDYIQLTFWGYFYRIRIVNITKKPKKSWLLQFYGRI
jgi:hypothetical protein